MSAATLAQLRAVDGRAGDRASVLVVGDADFAQRIRCAAHRCGAAVEVESVPTLLWAMGRARQCPAAIVVLPSGEPEPAAGGRPAAADHAKQTNGRQADPQARAAAWSVLRRVCPGVRLWVHVADPRVPDALRSAAAGVDELLLDPVSDDDLITLLRPVCGPAPAPAATGESDDEAELGDVDLVECLLGASPSAGDLGLAPLALRMIRQRGGVPGVAWHADPRDVPKGHCSVPVRFHGRDLGILHAPPAPAPGSDPGSNPGSNQDSAATAQALEGWAAWLARWLALESRLGQLQRMALRDDLTGVWNRRYFHRFLDRALSDAAEQRRQVTLLVFDIDDFKLYNDKYGHGAGDDILREAARLMQSVVRAHDVVARIGGDEFAVIFWDKAGPRKPDSQHPLDVLAAAKRFQKAICNHRFPKLLEEAPGTLTISGGLATYPWDGRTPQDLLERADAMAITSKRQGKNAITFGPGAAKACSASTLPGQTPDAS